ncbi:MAG: FIVAR domain-containing protein [Clostridia bacterium]|nr:FIVAR domain-containing protein [Clostridia bacterium]
MKLTKKLLSIALVIVMVLTMGTIAFAREASEVLDGTETITWSLKAQVMEGTGVSESTALDTESSTTNNSSVASSKVKAQRADVSTYKDTVADLEYYEAGNTTPIEVNPGDMIWITTHVATSESCYPTTLTQDWYYDSTFFQCVAMSAAQMTYTYEDSELMARADFGITGGSWTRLTINNRTNYMNAATGLTDAQRESYHLYHLVTMMDPDIMNDEYGGETVPVDEDVYAVPIYVSENAQPGQVGTICMAESSILLCEDSEGDYLETCYTIPASGHIVENQVLTFKVAGGDAAELDYTAINAQIADYEGRDADAYTTETWAAATTAYNAAVTAKESATEQTALDEAAEALKTALADLEEKVVLDYTNINNAIASVPADLSAYTTSTANAASTALAAAESVKASATTQAELDNATTALNEAVAALAQKANFTNLNSALDEATAIVDAGYTADSWSALQTAIATAQSFDQDETAITAQAQVNAAYDALVEAIDGLEKEVTLNYAKWNAAVANIPADLSGYTPASVSAYETAKAAAESAYNSAVAAKDQTALDAAADALQAAIDSLVAVADKAALKAAIADVPELAADMYSNWDAYATALATANDVDADANATQDAVDAAKDALVAAKAALTVAPADYSAVVAAKESVPADLSGYTADSAKAVTDAVAAVVEGKLKTEQADVDAMAKAIEDAVAALEALANYDAVETAKNSVPADLSIYTDDSVKAVNDAVAAVVYGLGETQQTVVDGYAAAINTAVTGLVEKDADYTAVNTALDKVEALNRALYTTASLEDIDYAVAQVVEGKKISAQAEVDAMAEAIETALAALQLKPTEGYVQETTSTDTPYAANTFTIKVTGRPNKVRFVDVNNTALTVTFSREAARAAGSIVSYNAAGEVVNDLSREIAYEIWTVSTTMSAGTYYVNAKDNDGWEALELSYIYEYKYSTDDKAVESIVAGVESANVYDFVPVTVVTGADVLKVQVVVNGVAIATYNNGVVGEDGKVTFEVQAKLYAVGENTISVNVKTADGWEAADASVVVTGVVAE